MSGSALGDAAHLFDALVEVNVETF